MTCEALSSPAVLVGQDVVPDVRTEADHVIHEVGRWGTLALKSLELDPVKTQEAPPALGEDTEENSPVA